MKRQTICFAFDFVSQYIFCNIFATVEMLTFINRDPWKQHLVAVLDRFLTEEGAPRFKPVNVTLNLNRLFIQQACFPFNSSFYRPTATVCFIADDVMVHLDKNTESRKPDPIWKQHLFQGSCAFTAAELLVLNQLLPLVSARISFIVSLRTRSTVLWAPRPGPWTITFFRFPKFFFSQMLVGLTVAQTQVE